MIKKKRKKRKAIAKTSEANIALIAGNLEKKLVLENLMLTNQKLTHLRKKYPNPHQRLYTYC
jgi:hypothetical protein